MRRHPFQFYFLFFGLERRRKITEVTGKMVTCRWLRQPLPDVDGAAMFVYAFCLSVTLIDVALRIDSTTDS